MEILAVIGAVTLFFIIVGVILFQAGVLQITAEIDKDD